MLVGYVRYEAAPAFEKKFAVHPAPLMGEYLPFYDPREGRNPSFSFQRTMKLWIFQPIEGRGRGTCLSRSHRDHPSPYPPGRYLPGQLHCPAFSRAKSQIPLAIYKPLGG